MSDAPATVWLLLILLLLTQCLIMWDLHIHSKRLNRHWELISEQWDDLEHVSRCMSKTIDFVCKTRERKGAAHSDN